jgi:hypothetical protein
MHGNGLLLMVFCGLFATGKPAFAQTWTQTSASTNQRWHSVASSADGTKLAAASSGFIPIYTSTNSGVTWMATSSTGVFWTSIASSADGCKLVATAPSSGIYTSTDSGDTWTQTSAPPTNWFSVASSADGVKLAAAVGNGALGFSPSSIGPIYTSTNSGATWAQTSAPGELWSCIASSADGNKLAAVMAMGPIYTSTNSGATWMQTDTQTNVNWSSVAISADGRKLIAANLPTVVQYANPPVIPGAVWTSADSGATWISNNVPDTAWQGVALSADGNKAVVISQFGQTYTSTNFGTTWTSNSIPSQPCAAVASSADGNKLVVAILFFSNSLGGGIYTSQLTPAPSMNITPTNGTLMLSWLVPSTNFVMQQSSDLQNWTDMTNQPVLNLTNLQNEVILSPPSSSGFYRLTTP